MKKIVVWFNHWFSTAYHIVNLIREDENTSFHVIGTNENEDSVVQLACDEWYKEPRLEEEEYVEYCLEFCKEHKIDIFIPRRHQLVISREYEQFEKLGTKVLVDKNYGKLMTLQNKGDTYELFRRLEIGFIPKYKVVNTVSEFEKAYQCLKTDSNRLCIKFVKDEGAMSFRVIDDRMEGYSGLLTPSGLKMSYHSVFNALSEKEEFPDLMVMPYLSGHEVSVDCLRTQKGLIAVPRFKTDTRMEIVRFDEEILQICNDFFKKYSLDCPCNIQFKYEEGIPYLLEINTRMSGGVQLSCEAARINIPNIAVNQLLGVEKDWYLDRTEKKITHIETPIML